MKSFKHPMAMRGPSGRGHEQGSSGFTLIELMVSVGVLLAVLGPVMALFAQLEHSYAGTQQQTQLQIQAQSALSLMASEIEMAGSNSAQGTTLESGVGPCSPCTLQLAGGITVNAGDSVWVDTGSSGESVKVISYTAASPPGQPYDELQADLVNSHATGATIYAPDYPFVWGIYEVQGSYTGTCPTGAICGSELQMFGNLEGNGTIEYADYNYNSTTQTLTRALTPTSGGSENTAYPICDHVSGVQFAIYPPTSSTLPGYPTLNLSLTVQSPRLNPLTGQYDSYNLQRGVIEARNVEIAEKLIANWESSNVPNTPTGFCTLVGTHTWPSGQTQSDPCS